MVDGLVVEQFGGDDLLDDLLENIRAELLSGDIVRVLDGDDDGVDTLGLDGTRLGVLGVLDGDLAAAPSAEENDNSGDIIILPGSWSRGEGSQGSRLGERRPWRG